MLLQTLFPLFQFLNDAGDCLSPKIPRQTFGDNPTGTLRKLFHFTAFNAILYHPAEILASGT